MAPHTRRELVVDALEMAVGRRRPAYVDFTQLERASTGSARATGVMLAEERERVQTFPMLPHNVCFGRTRQTCRTC